MGQLKSTNPNPFLHPMKINFGQKLRQGKKKLLATNLRPLSNKPETVTVLSHIGQMAKDTSDLFFVS